MVAASRNRIGLAAAIAVAVVLLIGGSIAMRQVRVASAERAKAAQRSGQLRELTRTLSLERVQDALKHLDDLAKEATGDRTLLREVASAYEKVAAIQSGAADDPAAALASREKAIAIREEMAKIGRDNPVDMQALADAYLATSELSMSNGAPDTAANYVQKAIPIAESLLASNPTPAVRLLCATSYRSIARALVDAGGTNIGNTRSALAYARGALKMQQGLVADFSQNLDFQQGLIATYLVLGSVYSAMGERDEELEQYRKAIAIGEQLAGTAPADVAVQRTLASLYAQLGYSHAKWAAAPNESQPLPQWQHAKDAYGRALAVYERLKAEGKLSDADAKRTDELAAEIANCDGALVAQAQPPAR